MSEIGQGWFASRFARLSTGLKMLLILSLGLFPLGLIAILASIESARENEAVQARAIQARAELKAQRIDSAISRSVLMLRAASAAIGPVEPGSSVCAMTLQRLIAAEQLPGRYAIHGAGGAVLCGSEGYRPPALPPTAPGRRRIVELDPNGSALRFALYDERGALAGSGEFDRERLSAFTDLPGNARDYDLELSGGGRAMMLRDDFEGASFSGAAEATEPIADGGLVLRLRTGAVPMSAAELLIILLPVMMWIAAAAIGWLIVDRLLLKPLVRMQRAVADYRPGDRNLDLPTLNSPAREIGELGLAFATVTQTVARHEAELEAGLERQVRLVREVHHRVKNNLQVVASLLNLHARGATSEDASAAYASIQRRVDALAVVHRNHYAELEDNRGVALKPLISELGANLRANAPPAASAMQIRIDIEPYYATQDVAVSVAFLVTEIVEYAMFCGAHGVTITIGGRTATTARFCVQSEALKGEAECDARLTERFDRIVTGLSRQLRSTLDRDAENGRYALDITVVERPDS